MNSRTDAESSASGKVPDKEEVSVFESQPKGARPPRRGARRRRPTEWRCRPSRPSFVACGHELLRRGAPSRRGPICAARVVDVSSTTVEEGTSGEPSVFESTPAPRFAAMRCSEEVVAENAGNCTFESCPTKSSAAVTWETQVTEPVFENQPLVSRVDTRWPRRRRTTRASAIR